MRRQMTVNIILLLTSIMLAGCTGQERAGCRPCESKRHPAVTPVQQSAKWAVRWWGQRHKQVNERLKKGHFDLLFIGDSITHGWEGTGRKTWNEYYKPRKALNMGFGGDRTEHVLWRLDHSNFKKVSPKLAVVMIGTNNSNDDEYTAEEIADGIVAVCERLRCRLPKTKILLLAIFPRGEGPSAQREKNTKASLSASRIADGKMIHYLDINSSFLTEDGILTKDIMPDYLHPNKAGYKIWAEAMEPKIMELMGENK